MDSPICGREGHLLTMGIQQLGEEPHTSKDTKETNECVVAVRVVADSSSRPEMGVHTGDAGKGPVGVTSEL